MKITLFILLALFTTSAFAQSDSTKRLNTVTVKGYYNPQPLLTAVGAVSILDSAQFQNQQSNSLIGIVNTAPGVRMEERSPGSYRLSLRGSLLRSPFGIRNIRVYIDDFPLTDAGGNTYLNAIAPAGISAMEIFKGPEASVFGANTGGAILINPIAGKKNQVEASMNAGSYNLYNQSATLQQAYGNYSFSLIQAYQKSDGYRENSALKRKYVQTAHEWNYNVKGKLKAFILYSDLAYQTPGGLNASQFAENPQNARPATPTLPGAIQQKAAIYNQTFYAGLSNNYRFNQYFSHIIAVFGSHTDFKNPFITNYEKRKENTLGLRTFIQYQTIKNDVNYQAQLGLESSQTSTAIDNYNNAAGTATSMQASDDLKANQDFAFLRFNVDINQRISLELGSSLNLFSYTYQNYFPTAGNEQEQSYKTRLMPKFAFSYLLTSNLSFRSSIARGYSPPTLAEIRSSDNLINTNLQAEAGWNYESGLRLQTNNKRFYADATIFYFKLQDAIVRRLNSNDTEYFINAGGTNQLGTEFQSIWTIIQNSSSRLINQLQLRSSYTFSHFRFDDFQNAQQDYSGNRLTGVPNHTLVNSIALDFKKGFYLFAQHNYTSAIPLNDANTFFANHYHLADLRAGIRKLRFGKLAFALSFGVNNLFNQSYSLGNDLNAANNRYYNPAAGINYDFGLKVSL